MYSFPDLEQVCCFMYSSNCCFLTCIQISQEAGQVIWYSHLLKNFPQFIVRNTVKGFVVNKELWCFFWNSLVFLMIQWMLTICSLVPLHKKGKQKQMFLWNSFAFLMIQRMLAIWSLVPLPFLKPAWTSEVHGSCIAEASMYTLTKI